jgi:hypothetical protein
MSIRLVLLVTQACTVITASLLAGSTHASTPAAVPVAGPARAVAVTTIRPVTRGLLATASPARKAASTPAVKTTPRRRSSSPTPKASSHRRAASHPLPTPKLTPRQRVDLAVLRIPGYRAGSIQWVLEAKDGFWGTADWYRNVIWISPTVPAPLLYDVVVHEWSHIRSVETYGGDVDLAMREMNRYFGGSGFTGAERAADCMARLQGALWTHYTTCQDASWRTGAARLLSGHRL